MSWILIALIVIFMWLTEWLYTFTKYTWAKDVTVLSAFLIVGALFVALIAQLIK